MNLHNPVVLTLPGETVPKTFTELPVTIVDSSELKTVKVQMKPFMKPLILWTGEDYTDMGDYTQAQVENKIIELLGDDPANILLSLYVKMPSGHHIKLK